MELRIGKKMNNYEFYVNVSEFQKKVLEFVTSGELDKFFENTVFDNYEYKNDCKNRSPHRHRRLFKADKR